MHFIVLFWQWEESPGSFFAQWRLAVDGSSLQTLERTFGFPFEGKGTTQAFTQFNSVWKSHFAPVDVLKRYTHMHTHTKSCYIFCSNVSTGKITITNTSKYSQQAGDTRRSLSWPHCPAQRYPGDFCKTNAAVSSYCCFFLLGICVGGKYSQRKWRWGRCQPPPQ